MSRQGNHNRREKEQKLRKPIEQPLKQAKNLDTTLISRKESKSVIHKRFLILCEGETEQAYFEGITTNVLFKNSLSGVHVQVIAPTHTKGRFDPERHLYDNSLQGLIWEAMQRKRLAKNRQIPYDEIWIVTDDDDDRERLFGLFENPNSAALFYQNNSFSYGQNRTESKPQEADFDPNWKKYVKMAYSCRSFEVWLLLHFEQNSTTYTSSDRIIEHIKTHAPLYEKGLCEPINRRKTSANAYEIMRCEPIVAYETSDNAQCVSNKIEQAIENSAWLKHIQQSVIEQNNRRFFGINPFTNVDALLIALLEKQTVIFSEIRNEIIGLDWTLKIEFEATTQQAIIYIKIAKNQRFLITNANFKDFFWIKDTGNQIIKPIELLTGTLNLPSINGDRDGELKIQFPTHLPNKAIALYFKWKNKIFIFPIF